jgi:hypothetical protein
MNNTMNMNFYAGYPINQSSHHPTYQIYQAFPSHPSAYPSAYPHSYFSQPSHPSPVYNHSNHTYATIQSSVPGFVPPTPSCSVPSSASLSSPISPSIHKKPTSTKCTKPCENPTCSFKGCSFAHSKDEFTPVHCKNGERCPYAKTTCFYIHPTENKDQYITRRGIKFFEKIEVEKKTSQKLKLCGSLVSGCCKNEECTYAHRFNELTVIVCHNGDECGLFREDKCEFIHPSQTMDDFLVRKLQTAGKVFLKRKKLSCTSSSPCSSPKSVESFSEESEESRIQPVASLVPRNLLIDFNDEDEE